MVDYLFLYMKHILRKKSIFKYYLKTLDTLVLMTKEHFTHK